MGISRQGTRAALEKVMEHWMAAVVASIVGIAMVALVVVVSFRVAGPGPRYTFTHQPTVGTVASP